MDNKIKFKKKHKQEFDRTKAVSVACSIILPTWHNFKVRNLFPLLIRRTLLFSTMPHEQTIIDLVCSPAMSILRTENRYEFYGGKCVRCRFI